MSSYKIEALITDSNYEGLGVAVLGCLTAKTDDKLQTDKK